MNTQPNETTGGSSNNTPTSDGTLPITPGSSILTSQPEYRESEGTNEVADNDATTRFDSFGRVAVQDISMNMSNQPFREQYETIKDFLARPYLVTSTTWSTGSSAGALLGSWTSIGGLIKSNTIWYSKVQGFDNVRGVCKLRFVINANPMQQGKLKLVWNPNYWLGLHSWRVQTLSQLSVLPGVEIDCRDTEAVFNIPFISPYNFYNLSGDLGDWGHYALYVIAPLQTGASGETTVSYAVFASFHDVELMTPLVPQSGNVTSRATRSKVTGEIRRSSKLSDLFATSSELMATTSPYLGPVVSTASWVTGFVGKVMTSFGYAKPLADTPAAIMSQLKVPYMSNYSGVNLAPMLALRHDNAVDLQDYHPNSVDQMSFDYLKQVPALVEVISFSTADTTGASIFGSMMTPWYTSGTSGVTRASFTNGGHTTVTAYPSPCGFIARKFKFCRGGMRLTLKIVKTQFHTGRYLVTWTPAFNYTTAPTLTTSQYSMRQVIDLSGPDDIVLELPYMYNTDWVGVTDDNKLGHLDILCVNPLRAPETCSGTISVLMYISGACDFEVSAPVSYWNNFTLPEPALYAQSGFLQNSPEPTVPTELVGSVGVCTKDSFSVERSSGGEVFTHLRQLLGKYGKAYVNDSTNEFFLAAANVYNDLYVNPYRFFSGLPSFTTAAGYAQTPYTFHAQFVNGFAFYKGSLKMVISVLNRDPSSYITTSLTNFSSFAYNNGNVTSSDLSGIHSTTPASSVPNELTQWHNANTGFAELSVPFYNKYRLVPADLSSSAAYQPSTAVHIATPGSNSDTATDYLIGLAAGEDFQCFLFLGFPGYVYSYA